MSIKLSDADATSMLLGRLALALAQQEGLLLGALGDFLESWTPGTQTVQRGWMAAAQLRLLSCTVSALAGSASAAVLSLAVHRAAGNCVAVVRQLPARLQSIAAGAGGPSNDAEFGGPPSEEWVDAAYAALADLRFKAAAVDSASLVLGGAALEQQQLDADRALGTLRCANLLCCNLEGSSEKQLHRRGCSRCRVVSYCCAACQQQDWPRHCAVCKALASQTTSP